MAVIITLMALDLKIPHGATLEALRSVVPTLAAYAISFTVIGTYWNNHHHLLRKTNQVHHFIMWANLNLLFWLSLIPFMTSWLGENYTQEWPTALYATLLIICGIAYQLLELAITKYGNVSVSHGDIYHGYKGWLSLLIYAAAIAAAFVNHWVSEGLLVLVSIMWFVPYTRLRRKTAEVEQD